MGLSIAKKTNPETAHGLSRSKIYLAWQSMRNRCYNPKDQRFTHYGQRGIGVCDRWRYSFLNFLADMGQPTPGQSLDRINNDADYSPSNCRWATDREQMRNRSNHVMVTAFGETKCLAAWAEDPRCQVKRMTLRFRLVDSGWEPERAIATPATSNKETLKLAREIRWSRFRASARSSG